MIRIITIVGKISYFLLCLHKSLCIWCNCIYGGYHTTLIKHQIKLTCYVFIHHSLASFHWPLVTQAELAVFAAEGSRWWAVCTHMMTNFLWKHPQYHRTVGNKMTWRRREEVNKTFHKLFYSFISAVQYYYFKVFKHLTPKIFSGLKEAANIQIAINELLYFGETLLTAVLT